MNDTLKQLYNRFYTPLPIPEAEQELKIVTSNSSSDWKSQRENWCCGSWITRV